MNQIIWNSEFSTLSFLIRNFCSTNNKVRIWMADIEKKEATHMTMAVDGFES